MKITDVLGGSIGVLQTSETLRAGWDASIDEVLRSSAHMQNVLSKKARRVDASILLDVDATEQRLRNNIS